MVKRKVTVILLHEDDGGYTAVIPTFPQLATMGDDVDHAFAMAKECLEVSLKEPSDWDYYSLDYAYSERVVVGAVEVDVPERPQPDESETDNDGGLSPTVLNSILQQAGITPEEFEEAAGEIL